jgi:hypothetical protein
VVLVLGVPDLGERLVNPGPKSELDRPCSHSSGSTSATRGDLRAHAGRIAGANRFRSPVAGSVRWSLTRGARTDTGPDSSACRATASRPDQTRDGLSIFLGKVRPFTSPRKGPSTGSDDYPARDG